jgi:hypothetical protein
VEVAVERGREVDAKVDVHNDMEVAWRLTWRQGARERGEREGG